MKKVVFFSGLNPEVTEIFREIMPEGFELACHSSTLQEAEKAALVKGAEFVVLHPGELSSAVLREAKDSLRLLQLLSAGYDKIDLQVTEELGIPVATNGGANAWAVAEHSIALLLALYRKIIPCDRSVRAGKWRQSVTGYDTFEIAGKTVGLLGAGNIGQKVARRLKAFEADILYYDANAVASLETDLGARKVSLEELLSKSDIITIHLPLLPDTRGLIGEKEFGMMKPTTVLLNASRAEIIDEEALITALQEKRIAGAGLDVFHKEPISPEDPLFSLDNVILSPHIAGHAYEGWSRRMKFAWQNIERVAGGEAPLSVARPKKD